MNQGMNFLNIRATAAGEMKRCIKKGLRGRAHLPDVYPTKPFNIFAFHGVFTCFNLP